MLIKASEENLDLLEANPGRVEEALLSLAESVLRRDFPQEKRRTLALAKAIGEGMALADLLGRRRTWIDTKALAKRSRPRPNTLMAEFMAARFTTVASQVPKIPFEEAFDDLVSRTPELAKSAADVRDAYGLRHGFTLLRLPWELAEKARMSLTQKIQKMLAGYIQTGEAEKNVREQLSDVGGFTKAYASTVYRTNMATAYTAGRMKQLKDPEVQDIVPALEHNAVRDSDVRPNHLAADGFLAALDHPEWERISPPLGWNCRCNARSVDKYELKNRGLLLPNGGVKPYYPSNFAAAGPDRGFRRARPDRTVYGGGV